MERGLGPVVVAVGILVVVVGLLISVGALQWFGNLPGDVRLEGERTRIFLPITSMLLASVALTVAINVVLRLLR